MTFKEYWNNGVWQGILLGLSIAFIVGLLIYVISKGV